MVKANSKTIVRKSDPISKAICFFAVAGDCCAHITPYDDNDDPQNSVDHPCFGWLSGHKVSKPTRGYIIYILYSRLAVIYGQNLNYDELMALLITCVLSEPHPPR